MNVIKGGKGYRLGYCDEYEMTGGFARFCNEKRRSNQGSECTSCIYRCYFRSDFIDEGVKVGVLVQGVYLILLKAVMVNRTGKI